MNDLDLFLPGERRDEALEIASTIGYRYPYPDTAHGLKTMLSYHVHLQRENEGHYCIPAWLRLNPSNMPSLPAGSGKIASPFTARVGPADNPFRMPETQLPYDSIQLPSCCTRLPIWPSSMGSGKPH